MFPRINPCVVVALILASSEAVTVTKSLCVGGENVTINANVIIDECDEDAVTEPECPVDFTDKCQSAGALFCPADGRCYTNLFYENTFEFASETCGSYDSSFQATELPSIEDLENKITLSCASKALHKDYFGKYSPYWHKGSISPTNCTIFFFETETDVTIMAKGVKLDDDQNYCDDEAENFFFCILTP